MDIVDDLAAEQERLEALLSRLTESQWASPSAAPGWSIADTVLHLAQSEEGVVYTLTTVDAADPFHRAAAPLDDAVDQAVRSQRASADAVFERWCAARRAALEALRAADPDRRVPWAAAPLRPAVLATTRLAEHWAHGLDITGPLNLAYDDTDRLRHIAWLGHRTLPYAFEVEGLEPQEVYCELTAPDGTTTWRYGPAGADSTVRGPAGDFCRVGARRLTPDQTQLIAEGPHAATALRVLRNYAV